MTVLEAGPGPGASGVAGLTGDGLRLPIGVDSPVVARFETVLTDRPARTTSLVRGATVGGSGAVNGGYFCRALPSDLDEWGLDGWSWSDLLPHFRAVETDLDFPDAPAHGGRGPIRVRRAREIVGATAHLIESAADAGYRWLDDLNDGSSAMLPTGIGLVPSNIVDGVRTGSGAAFLVPASDRPNLMVLPGTRAVRVLFDGPRATGVRVVGPAGPQVLTADRIVLCAGAIGTAHLLMLSGIGDEAMLRRVGVPVVSPAPVGRRTADHPEWVLPTDWPTAPSRPALEVVLSLAEGVEIRPYTGGFVAMVGDGDTGHPDWPHLGVALMKPRARGEVQLVSADAAVPPVIAHHYDSEPRDLATLQLGTDVARQLASAATHIGDWQWSTSQHLCGTAPMGADGDEAAVLDTRCRVRGVDGLWVIDGSIMPSIPSRGPHATTVALAHRAADFVRTD